MSLFSALTSLALRKAATLDSIKTSKGVDPTTGKSTALSYETSTTSSSDTVETGQGIIWYSDRTTPVDTLAAQSTTSDTTTAATAATSDADMTVSQFLDNMVNDASTVVSSISSGISDLASSLIGSSGTMNMTSSAGSTSGSNVVKTTNPDPIKSTYSTDKVSANSFVSRATVTQSQALSFKDESSSSSTFGTNKSSSEISSLIARIGIDPTISTTNYNQYIASSSSRLKSGYASSLNSDYSTQGDSVLTSIARLLGSSSNVSSVPTTNTMNSLDESSLLSSLFSSLSDNTANTTTTIAEDASSSTSGLSKFISEFSSSAQGVSSDIWSVVADIYSGSNVSSLGITNSSGSGWGVPYDADYSTYDTMRTLVNKLCGALNVRQLYPRRYNQNLFDILFGSAIRNGYAAMVEQLMNCVFYSSTTRSIARKYFPNALSEKNTAMMSVLAAGIGGGYIGNASGSLLSLLSSTSSNTLSVAEIQDIRNYEASTNTSVFDFIHSDTSYSDSSATWDLSSLSSTNKDYLIAAGVAQSVIRLTGGSKLF